MLNYAPLLFCLMLSSDVYFWVDGGRDQPNCGVVVDPLVLRTAHGAKGVNVKNCNAASNLEFFTQQETREKALCTDKVYSFHPHVT